MNVLFLGSLSGTSLNRFNYLQEIADKSIGIDPRKYLKSSLWVDRIIWHLGPKVFLDFIEERIISEVSGLNFDLVFVDSGSLVSKTLVKRLKKISKFIVNYNHDDPFGKRDWRRFSAYRDAVGFYDLLVVVRRENIEEAYSYGAKNVLFQYRVADEKFHSPIEIDDDDIANWSSEVSFVGTWMPGRGKFIRDMIDAGVPISVYGAGWDKSSHWKYIKNVRRTSNLDRNDYRKAIQCSKICIGLLSHENRDKHTTRSIEIPFNGSVLCAEDTEEHRTLYESDVEAVFWKDSAECAEKCLFLLKNPNIMQKIKSAGRARALKNNLTTSRSINEIIKISEMY